MVRWGRIAAALAAVCVAGFAGVSAAHASASRARLDRSLAGALAVPHLARNAEGALALDLASGRVVYSYAPDRSLEPASNEKLAVTYAALVRLGPGYRFRTEVLTAGRRLGSVLAGNLYLKGHGDPTLHTLALVRLAQKLRAEGIRRVTGRVLADESWFDTRRTAPGWKASFAMNESPPLSALVVNRAAFRGAMSPTPAGAAAAIFTTVLQRHGVAVGHGSDWGTAPRDARLLARTASQPLSLVIRFMDHWSDNFTAEMLLKTLGKEETGRGTTAAGAAVVRRVLARAEVPLAGVHIVDGSGLSRFDRFTPRALGSILAAAWRDDSLRRPFWRALAVAGESGTLRNRMLGTRAAGAVHAKTGTTDVASALSGFVGARYAFAVVQNGHPVQSTWAHKAQDRFARALAARR
jgi:D-alanyl-D-alanine carboxypeptidase/D-alanyl-D-alanine-endopeptidase (penicillin-binding protein 4)